MSRWHTTEFDLLPERAFRPRGGRGGGMTFEGGGKGSAPAPDPRMGEAALKQIALNEKQYNDYRTSDMPWMRGIAEQALGISRANADRAGALSDYQLGQMKYYDDRFKNIVAPMENRLMSDVERFDSQGYKDATVGRAMSDTQQSFDTAIAQGLRMKQRMGLNPASGGFFDPQMDIAKATALSSAANKTRLAADQIGLANKMQLYGGMKGMSGLGMTNASLATGAIGAGNASGMGMTGAGNAYLGANNAALAGYNSGTAAGVNGLGQYSSLGIQAANVNAQNDPFNTILGAAAGGAGAYGMKMLMGSDRRLKTDIKLVGKMDNGLNVYTYRYKSGGPTMMGVMADEVARVSPQAYVPGAINGFDAVDYSKL